MVHDSLERWYQQNWRYSVEFRGKRGIGKLTCFLLFPSPMPGAGSNSLLCPLLLAPQPFTVQILLPSPQSEFQRMPHLIQWHYQTSTSLPWYLSPWLLQLRTLFSSSKNSCLLTPSTLPPMLASGISPGALPSSQIPYSNLYGYFPLCMIRVILGNSSLQGSLSCHCLIAELFF